MTKRFWHPVISPLEASSFLHEHCFHTSRGIHLLASNKEKLTEDVNSESDSWRPPSDTRFYVVYRYITQFFLDVRQKTSKLQNASRLPLPTHSSIRNSKDRVLIYVPNKIRSRSKSIVNLQSSYISRYHLFHNNLTDCLNSLVDSLSSLNIRSSETLLPRV